MNANKSENEQSTDNLEVKQPCDVRRYSDKEILDWLDSTQESWVTLHRYYNAIGEKYAGGKVCSEQMKPCIHGKDVREVLSKIISTS